VTAATEWRNGQRLELAVMVERLDNNYRRHQQRPTTGKCGDRFPLSSFYRIVGAMSQLEVAEMTGKHPRTVALWHHEGSVTAGMADVLALGANLHPVLIWGDAW